MKLTFDYKLEMEWENYIRIRKSKNHPEKPVSTFEILAKEAGVDTDNREAILAFYKLETKRLKFDITSLINQYQRQWNPIEKEVEARNKKIFNTEIDIGNLTAYLTIRDRCAYSIDGRYFFVRMRGNDSNFISMHEIQHFYTIQLIYPILQKAKANEQQCNDFKEALTFLLNIEFADLMAGKFDSGYKIHQELRPWLHDLWTKKPDIYYLTEEYIKRLSA